MLGSISTVFGAATRDCDPYGRCRCGLPYFSVFLQISHTVMADFCHGHGQLAAWSHGHGQFLDGQPVTDCDPVAALTIARTCITSSCFTSKFHLGGAHQQSQRTVTHNMDLITHVN